MANPPKKTGPKPTAKAQPAKTEAVALTAAQALKAMDQAIGTTAAPKRPYVRKAPAPAKVEAPVATVPVAAEPVIETPVAREVATPEPEMVAAPEVAPEITVEEKVEENAAPETVAPAIPTVAARAEGTMMMNDVIENTKKYTEEAKARFQSAFGDISGKAKAATEKSTKAMEEMSDIAKGNVEALVESGKIAAKGFETMGQDAAEYGRMSFEKATATMKSLAAVKSPTEFFQLQSELMSSAFDGFAKEAAKNSEAMLKLAGDVAQPLSSRVALVTEKVKALAA